MAERSPTPSPSEPGEAERALGPALRQAASRAAERAGGGVALVFTRESPQAGPRLRAASGFSSAEAARIAAAAVEPLLERALESGEAQSGTPEVALGGRAGDEVRVLPLALEGRVHGALAASGHETPDEGARAGLRALAEGLALRLDHAALARRLRALESSSAPEPAEGDDERSDEILKLSEALFAQDIELLRSHEKLGKVEKLKNDFIEKMSRELRTPLNSIIESIISVLAGENESLSDSAKASLRGALDEGTSFLRTLQNILDLWRVKQNELPVEAQEVNFREVVEEAIFSVQDALGDKPVTIEKEIAEPLPKVRTDLAKVNQILFLVLENAAKFTREGRIAIGVAVEGEQLYVRIADTGIGIAADDRALVFDEFFQVDELASGQYRGAGLGLALVRDLVALLDGEVELTSEVGRGTCVTFSLPVQVL